MILALVVVVRSTKLATVKTNSINASISRGFQKKPLIFLYRHPLNYTIVVSYPLFIDHSVQNFNPQHGEFPTILLHNSTGFSPPDFPTAAV